MAKTIRSLKDLPKTWLVKLSVYGGVLHPDSVERVTAQLRSDAYYAHLDGRNMQARKFHRYADVIDATIRKQAAAIRMHR